MAEEKLNSELSRRREQMKQAVCSNSVRQVNAVLGEIIQLRDVIRNPVLTLGFVIAACLYKSIDNPLLKSRKIKAEIIYLEKPEYYMVTAEAISVIGLLLLNATLRYKPLRLRESIFKTENEWTLNVFAYDRIPVEITLQENPLFTVLRLIIEEHLNDNPSGPRIAALGNFIEKFAALGFARDLSDELLETQNFFAYLQQHAVVDHTLVYRADLMAQLVTLIIIGKNLDGAMPAIAGLPMYEQGLKTVLADDPARMVLSYLFTPKRPFNKRLDIVESKDKEPPHIIEDYFSIKP